MTGTRARASGTRHARIYGVSSFDPQAYWDKRHSARYGPESVGFMGLGVPFNVWMYRVRAHVVARAIRSAGIDLHRCDVLDVGSGTGFYLDLWTKLGARSVTGSDFAPFAVRSLREKFPDLQVFELDITAPALPPKLGAYNLVSAFDILYHIVDDARYAQAFENLGKLLRPGGCLAFSENFLSGSRDVGLHQVSRTRAEIASLLEDTGFEVLHSAPVFIFMNRPLKSRSRVLSATWQAIVRATAQRDHPGLGHWLGAALYPVEITALHLSKTGPTTEIMICRRRN